MLIGIILIFLGVYFIVKMLCPGFDIDINWNIIWPVILMVLGIEGIIRSKKLDLFNAILTLIGVIYLLSGLKIIGNINGRLIFAIILIGAGISFILSSLGKKKVKKISKDKMINYNGIFGGVKEVVKTKDFKGANCYSIFGGIKLDLKNTSLKDDTVIICYAVFGGIDLTVPDDVNIIIHSSSLFGGVNNKTSNKNNDNKKTIYINVTAIFGGVDVKE